MCVRKILKQIVGPYRTFRYIYARVAQLVPMRRFMHEILFARYAMQPSHVFSPLQDIMTHVVTAEDTT